MNLAEGLSRQIARVSEMKAAVLSMVDTPGVNMSFYILSCTSAIDQGHVAAGSDDIGQMKTAYEALAKIN